MSEILDNWTAGRGLPGVLVIDGHTHIGDWPQGTTYHSVEEAVEESAALMDANGVDAACAMSGGYMMYGADYRLGNDFLLAVCKGLPERIIGFALVNPNDSRDAVLDELKRVHDEGVRCIKLINSYQNDYPGDGPNLMAVYEFAAGRNMLVFNHAWCNDVLESIAAKFPQTDFVCGHYSNRYDPILKARPNVYSNIWSYGPLGWLDDAYREVGAGKLLFGSDAFLNPMSVGIGPVVFAEIPDGEKRQVLGLTMARLLDKVGALPAALKRAYPEIGGVRPKSR